MPAVTPLPLVLRRSARKTILLLAVALAFTAGGFIVARENLLVGGGCIAFFGLCAIVFAINLHPRAAYVELTQDGFTISSLFRRHFTRWTQVAEFFPISVQSKSMVGWNYSAEFTGSATARRFATALSGAEAALPDTYGMRAADLAELLNRVRERNGR